MSNGVMRTVDQVLTVQKVPTCVTSCEYCPKV